MKAIKLEARIRGQLRKINAEISKQTHGRQIQLTKMHSFFEAVKAAVNAGMSAADSVAQEIPNFYEPAGTPANSNLAESRRLHD